MALGQVEKTVVVIFVLVSGILTVIAYLAPESYNRNNISLLMVLPSSSPGSSSPTDGATVILGIFGMKFHIISYPKINLDHHRV